MAEEAYGSIVAIITSETNKIQGGGCPIFFAEDEAEMKKLSHILARCSGGAVHDLENGVYFVIKH